MKPENDKALCEKYPKIFRDRNKSAQETCMSWGFEHGDGWFGILDAACSLMQQHTDNKRQLPNNKWLTEEEWEAECQPVAAQVKEKWGGLRFYVDNADDYCRGVIDLAERMSLSTCEVCGAPGKRAGGGWIRTLCEEHSKR